jgi:hypothetical protein
MFLVMLGGPSTSYYNKPGEKKELCAVPLSAPEERLWQCSKFDWRNISPQSFGEKTVFVTLGKRRHGFPSYRNMAGPFSRLHSDSLG